jgi:hypothetical protein
MNDASGWSAYEKLVLGELNDLKAELAQVEQQLVLMRIDIATLKVKSGLWGAVAGAIPALVAIVVVLVTQ